MRVFELSNRKVWTQDLPEEFRSPYKLGRFPEDRVQSIMWKYLGRDRNCERAWVRINHHLPETLHTGKPLDILEFSTAHGAMLEIWRSLGHRVVGTDFPWETAGRVRAPQKGVRRPWHASILEQVRQNSHKGKIGETVPGWSYQPVIESLGLDVRLFDGGVRPYPFEDKSFDVVCCYQAIEAYSDPDGWLDTVAEFCRIARKSVVVGFNPLPVESLTNRAMLDAAKDAWLKMQSFEAAGLRTSFFEIGQSRRGIHPTVCKLTVA